MKPKFSALALKAMALDGQFAAAPCEMRAFAAHHAATLDARNHIAFVEAFLVQLGARAQHARILELLATCGREFHVAQGRIAYKPPDAAQLTSVLDVGRWVSARLDGGLAHAQVPYYTCRKNRRFARYTNPQFPSPAPHPPGVSILKLNVCHFWQLFRNPPCP